MKHCINLKSPDFQALVKESNIHPAVLAAKMSVYMDKNNTSEWPSLDQLDGGISYVLKAADILLSNKEKIEKEYEEPLAWEFAPTRIQQYIRSYCPLGGLDDMEQWPDIQKDLVDRLVRFEKAIGPYLNSL